VDENLSCDLVEIAIGPDSEKEGQDQALIKANSNWSTKRQTQRRIKEENGT
jgi:hypothetical protein